MYGLFIANRIDTNTAETFRTGIWYSQDDVMQRLQIVPFTLKQFSFFFRRMFSTNNHTPENVIALLSSCGSRRDELNAPEWKEEIETQVLNALSVSA